MLRSNKLTKERIWKKECNIPYALGAFLIGIIGGFTAVLAPAFVKDLGLDYNNTTWTALAMSISTAAFAALFLTQGLMQANMTNIIVFVN